VLDREKVIVALEEKRNQFENYAGDLRRQRETVTTRLATIQTYDYFKLSAFLIASGIASPGALPTTEWDEAEKLCLPFGQKWATHEDARAWAREVLMGRPVAAVDGSQIMPDKDLNLPVGAVQVGWFINPHQAGTPYVKDVDFQVLGPAELAVDAEDEADDRAMPNWRVSQERFIRECEQLCTIMASGADASQQTKPLCFFDGSFIISFAGQLRPERATPYLAMVETLLRCSADSEVPLVAFVDRSYSRDFVTLIDLISGARGQEALTMSDAAIFDRLLPNWGDRSPLFYCARVDKLSRENLVPFYNDVAFTYVRLTRDRPPARVEMPRWMVEAGLAEDAINLVRAECVVGAGYPYAIETADALAVISRVDRERFYNLFEQFAHKSGLELVQARKAASKVVRR
jgi:hypothetical protein